MSRLVRGRAPSRDFDIAFWQKLGPARIFEAAWDLVVTAAAVRGISEDQLRLQRSVMLQNLNAAGVRYLIVSGYAVMVHTEPRYTKDLDVWIKPHLDNARALLAALLEFGAPTAGVKPEDFTDPEIFFQIGVDPVRVDIMTSVTGLDFETAWDRRIEVDFSGVQAPVLSRSDILAAKIASGRARDRRDARYLRGD